MAYPKEFRMSVLGELRASGLGYKQAAARFPHFPCASTLSNWDRQARRDGVEVPLPKCRGRVEGHEKHSRYPEETRREALRLLGAGEKAGAVAARLAVPRGVVNGWASKARRACGAPAAGTIAPGKGAVAVKGGKAAGKGSYEELKRERDELETQVRVLVELMDDPKAGGPARLSNRRKTELGERLRRETGCSLRSLTTSLHISRSTYEYNRRALLDGPRGDGDAALRERVRRDFEASRGVYGYRRIHAETGAGSDGAPAERVSEKRVRRAMRAQGLEAATSPRRRRYSSYGGEVDGARPRNVPYERAKAARRADPSLRRTHDFSADAPDSLVVTDVTEFHLNGFKCYLSPVVDCFDGMPVSWSISRHPDSELCDSSLRSYVEGLPRGHAPLVEHSDGGACYRTASWKAVCPGNGVERPVSRKGACPDNARAEGFFGALKNEFFYGREWAGATYEEFSSRLDAYLRWYRDGRLKAFRDEGGRVRYETISGRRRRLGLAV